MNHKQASRIARVFVFLLFLASHASATRYAFRSTETCVADSDFIFVGRILRAKSFESGFVGGIVVQYTATPTRMLRGHLPKTAVLRGSAVPPSGAGNTFIFFARRPDPPFPGIDGGLAYGDIHPLNELKRVQTLIDWCEHPEKHIGTPATAKTSDFLLLTSSRLQAATTLGRLPRESLIGHFRSCLDPSDPNLAWAAVQALLRVGDAASAPLIIKLLADDTTAFAAAYFLARHPIPEAVIPLCDRLDRTAAEDHNGCERMIAIALMRLNATEALPAIRRAVERGLCWEIRYALGYFGDTEDFRRLLPGLDLPNPFASHTGLLHLVRRSNLPEEPWMKDAGIIGDRGFTTKDKWVQWLDQNKELLKISKTAAQAKLQSPTP